MLNSFWVYIFPLLFNVYYMVLIKSFILQVPRELEEAMEIDGANELKIFMKLIVPLSLPIIATIGLFQAVEQWNSWQDTLYFVQNKSLEPLQYVLMKILRQNEANSIANNARYSLRNIRRISITPQSIKMAITVVTTVPILVVYPFIQRYFVKGIMVGAVKG